MATEGSMAISGFRELDQALVALGKSLGKGVLRRVGKARLEPMRKIAEAKAPVWSGATKKDIKVGTVLAPSQRKAAASWVSGQGMRQEAKNSVTVYMGPGQQPQAIVQEFGSFKEPPQPFMRPAFDAEAQNTITGIGDDLWYEIARTAARKARREARAAG